MKLKPKKEAKRLVNLFYNKDIENSFGKQEAIFDAQHYALICLETQMDLLATLGNKKAWGLHSHLLNVRIELLSF